MPTAEVYSVQLKPISLSRRLQLSNMIYSFSQIELPVQRMTVANGNMVDMRKFENI